MPYERIIFMQGDDADEPLAILFNREPGHSFPYYLGVTAESVAATFAYLAQWDSGDGGEITDEPSSGTSDDVWEEDGYRLSANLGLSYVGLERVVLIREPGYFTCPCCGDVAIGNGREPVCADCADAGCEETVDATGEPGYWNCDRSDVHADGAA